VVDSVAQLEMFHRRLDELVKLAVVLVRDLKEKGRRDDAVMQRWKSGRELSEAESTALEIFETWQRSMLDFCIDKIETPKVGAESYLDFVGLYPTNEIGLAFVRCREAIGYSETGDVPRRALKKFEWILYDFARMMSSRLTMDWPRPSIREIEGDVMQCLFYFGERELQDVANLTECRFEWWHGTPSSTGNSESPETPQAEKADNDSGPLASTESAAEVLRLGSAKDSADRIAVWDAVFQMPTIDAVENVRDAAFYAEFPAELADELATDFLRLEKAGVESIRNDFIRWFVSPLTQPPEYYRLLSSLLPQCPVNFMVFASLRTAANETTNTSFQLALQSVRSELRLLGLWLESTGLWAKRPEEEKVANEIAAVGDGDAAPVELVNFEVMAERLTKAGCPISAKRISNLYSEDLTVREKWGEPDDKDGNGFLFNWHRLLPILSERFARRLKKPLE
jgi:hypothetical protein